MYIRFIERKSTVIDTQIKISLLQIYIMTIDVQIALLILEIMIDIIQCGLRFANLFAIFFAHLIQQALRFLDDLALFQQVLFHVVTN